MKLLNFLKNEINYLFAKRYSKKIISLNYQVMTIMETLDFMIIRGNSIVRFGDGEINLMKGIGISNYQKQDERLSSLLKKAVLYDDKKMLICLPDTLVSLNDKKKNSQKFWLINFKNNFSVYKSIKRDGYLYGNAFVSRPYMIYKENNSISTFFYKLKSFFSNKDIVIVEGKYSRTGVGNDLFEKTRSLKRIICPPINAFEKMDEIIRVVETKINRESLVLVALGPAAKPICIELFERGYWVWDIGHIDTEYEWFKLKAKKKIEIKNKHTAEKRDCEIFDCEDTTYVNSILTIIE